ncbi:hypothetical protein [Streptomyces sp. NPDC096351]|uniref:hypothetical protein n=1 Tax=Streptomyces sp. NPDC096351 TaxID=3366087 RepID=UPI0037F10D18
MNARDLAAGISELMATPFIPELHEDDCPDPNCTGCVAPAAPTRPRQQEDPHDGPLATHYELSRDMPETTA